MQDPTNNPDAPAEARPAERPAPDHGITIVVVDVPTGIPLRASCLCGWQSEIVPTRAEATVEGQKHVNGSRPAPRQYDWHPLWCRVQECDGENHQGERTRWIPQSDDVAVELWPCRWDSGRKGSAGYERGIPKVILDLENLAMLPEPAPPCPPWCIRTHYTGGWDRAGSGETLTGEFFVEKVCFGARVQVASADGAISARLRRFAVIDAVNASTWDAMYVGDTEITVDTAAGAESIVISVEQADELAHALTRLGDETPPK